MFDIRENTTTLSGWSVTAIKLVFLWGKWASEKNNNFIENKTVQNNVFFPFFKYLKVNLKTWINLTAWVEMSGGCWRIWQSCYCIFIFLQKHLWSFTAPFYSIYSLLLRCSTVSLCFLRLVVHAQLTHAVHHISTPQTHACVYYRSITGQVRRVRSLTFVWCCKARKSAYQWKTLC